MLVVLSDFQPITSKMTNKDLLIVITELRKEIVELRKQLNPEKKQKFYSYKEAAEMLRITVDGLKSRIKRGQMLRVTNNHKPLIAHTEIMRFLESQNPDGVILVHKFVMQLLLKQIRFAVYRLYVCFPILRNG